MTRHNAALNHQRDLDHAATVNTAVRASTGSDLELTYTPQYVDPADARQLRGIPAVGGRGSMGGAITGSRPDTLSWDKSPRRSRSRNVAPTDS